MPALEPFQVSPSDADINLQIEWVQKLFPIDRPPLFDSGTTWRLYQEDSGFIFDFTAPRFGEAPYRKLFLDSSFRCGLVRMSEQSLTYARSQPSVAVDAHSLSPLEYPLDELLIMHRLTQEKAIELHGCGIVRADGTGNLFVGHSGAGKSTTTRLWTGCEDVEVLSDDRIIVRRDEGREKQVPHRRYAPVRNDNAKQVPHLRLAEVRNDSPKHTMRMYGTPWHGEAMYASPNSAALTRIFVLEHGRGNLLTSLSPSLAVAELFARSFVPFHRHEYVDSALAFLQELVDAVPVYRYSFEPDQRAVDTIRNFHD